MVYLIYLLVVSSAGEIPNFRKHQHTSLQQDGWAALSNGVRCYLSKSNADDKDWSVYSIQNVFNSEAKQVKT